MTTIEICKAGQLAERSSRLPARPAKSVCDQEVSTRPSMSRRRGIAPGPLLRDGEGGDVLASQRTVKGMCAAAAGIVFLLDRMGVPFRQTKKGTLDFRRSGGTLVSRTAFGEGQHGVEPPVCPGPGDAAFSEEAANTPLLAPEAGTY